MMDEPIYNPDHIHTYFGLSYANYLVLPRSALQSMPDEWQEKFVTLLEELNETIELADEHGNCMYQVQMRDHSGRYIQDPLMDYERGRRKLPRKDTTQ